MNSFAILNRLLHCNSLCMCSIIRWFSHSCVMVDRKYNLTHCTKWASSGMLHIASNCTSYMHVYLATRGCRYSLGTRPTTRWTVVQPRLDQPDQRHHFCFKWKSVWCSYHLFAYSSCMSLAPSNIRDLCTKHPPIYRLGMQEWWVISLLTTFDLFAISVIHVDDITSHGLDIPSVLHWKHCCYMLTLNNFSWLALIGIHLPARM